MFQGGVEITFLLICYYVLKQTANNHNTMRD